ncbi:MAG: hypothetical protein HZB82_00010 [Deltaproteobacteria bacterium]|nr:hypothetical protein [Deltaproteobacteria bacterium]
MKFLLLIFLIFNLTACTHALSVTSNFVSTNQMQFDTAELKTKTAFILITPEFKNYQFTKKAYNWAGGSLFPDTIIFDLGNTLTSEINSLGRSLFKRTLQSDSLEESKNQRADGADYIVVPKIISTSLELPIVRLGQIDAIIQIEYTFYRSDGVLLTSIILSGNGQKRLELTKQNYVIALQEAVKDLMLKSKEAFISVMR